MSKVKTADIPKIAEEAVKNFNEELRKKKKSKAKNPKHEQKTSNDLPTLPDDFPLVTPAFRHLWNNSSYEERDQIISILKELIRLNKEKK